MKGRSAQIWDGFKPKSTQAAARDACGAKLAQYEAEIFAEQRKRQREYDDKTKHGSKQSEVGGEDVQLVCP
ncbi:MAG: DUF922 domain-containing protein [Chloroflexi bacterium]|nr:DUF922 domain-containing protein [Chloroflexota bacterium]